MVSTIALKRFGAGIGFAHEMPETSSILKKRTFFKDRNVREL
jgi:hypothetical protein